MVKINTAAVTPTNNTTFTRANMVKAGGLALAVAIAAIGITTIALAATQGTNSALTNFYGNKHGVQIAYGVGAGMVALGVAGGAATIFITKTGSNKKEKILIECEREIKTLENDVKKKNKALLKASENVNGTESNREAFLKARGELALAQANLSKALSKKPAILGATSGVEFMKARVKERDERLAETKRIQDVVLMPFVEAHVKKVDDAKKAADALKVKAELKNKAEIKTTLTLRLAAVEAKLATKKFFKGDLQKERDSLRAAITKIEQSVTEHTSAA